MSLDPCTVVELTRHGQRYILAGTMPHIRRDGTATTLRQWRSHCAECGEAFICTTPGKAVRFEPSRRCQRHKRPGQRVPMGGVSE